MRFHFDNVNLNATTGPNTFASRLARKLFELGHVVEVDNSHLCDTSIVFIERTGRPLANKVIQRLDGIWTKPHEFVNRNASIRSVYDQADAVVWQSAFDKQMITKHWGPKFGSVIHNGIDIDLAKFKNEPLLDIRAEHSHMFVCSANWHPQKRLRANIDLFFHMFDTITPKACLVVMGSNPDCYVSHPKVFYTGTLRHEQCLQIYRNADCMFHLAYADHCPNTVVEALSQGCPVVCSNIGGTKELVGDFGVIVDEGEFAFEPFDHDAPPAIDVSKIELREYSSLGKHADIDINVVAAQYVKLAGDIA